MKNARLNSLRLLALIVTFFTALSACATSPASKADHFAVRDANAFDPATIDAVGDKVDVMISTGKAIKGPHI